MASTDIDATAVIKDDPAQELTSKNLASKISAPQQATDLTLEQSNGVAGLETAPGSRSDVTSYAPAALPTNDVTGSLKPNHVDTKEADHGIQPPQSPHTPTVSPPIAEVGSQSSPEDHSPLHPDEHLGAPAATQPAVGSKARPNAFLLKAKSSAAPARRHISKPHATNKGLKEPMARGSKPPYVTRKPVKSAGTKNSRLSAPTHNAGVVTKARSTSTPARKPPTSSPASLERRSTPSKPHSAPILAHKSPSAASREIHNELGKPRSNSAVPRKSRASHGTSPAARKSASASAASLQAGTVPTKPRSTSPPGRKAANTSMGNQNNPGKKSHSTSPSARKAPGATGSTKPHGASVAGRKSSPTSPVRVRLPPIQTKAPKKKASSQPKLKATSAPSIPKVMMPEFSSADASSSKVLDPATSVGTGPHKLPLAKDVDPTTLSQSDATMHKALATGSRLSSANAADPRTSATMQQTGQQEKMQVSMSPCSPPPPPLQLSSTSNAMSAHDALTATGKATAMLSVSPSVPPGNGQFESHSSMRAAAATAPLPLSAHVQVQLSSAKSAPIRGEKSTLHSSSKLPETALPSSSETNAPAPSTLIGGRVGASEVAIVDDAATLNGSGKLQAAEIAKKASVGAAIAADPAISTQRQQASLAKMDLGLVWPPKIPKALEDLREGRSGTLRSFNTPFGPRMMVYADYASSSHFLVPLEAWMADSAYPTLANVPTELGWHARQRDTFMDGACKAVEDFCTASRGMHSVVFTDACSISKLREFARLLGIRPRQSKGALYASSESAKCPTIIVSNLEPHSKIMFWQALECTLEVCTWCWSSQLCKTICCAHLPSWQVSRHCFLW
jgi:hypothetical protein